MVFLTFQFDDLFYSISFINECQRTSGGRLLKHHTSDTFASVGLEFLALLFQHFMHSNFICYKNIQINLLFI